MSVLALALVARIQVVDEAHGQIDERIAVVLAGPGDGIRQIGQQREMQIRIGIGQAANFQLLDQFADLRLVQQQRGNHDHGGGFGGNSIGEVHLGQRQRPVQTDEMVLLTRSTAPWVAGISSMRKATVRPPMME